MPGFVVFTRNIKLISRKLLQNFVICQTYVASYSGQPLRVCFTLLLYPAIASEMVLRAILMAL